MEKMEKIPSLHTEFTLWKIKCLFEHIYFHQIRMWALVPTVCSFILLCWSWRTPAAYNLEKRALTRTYVNNGMSAYFVAVYVLNRKREKNSYPTIIPLWIFGHVRIHGEDRGGKPDTQTKSWAHNFLNFFLFLFFSNHPKESVFDSFKIHILEFCSIHLQIPRILKYITHSWPVRFWLYLYSDLFGDFMFYYMNYCCSNLICTAVRYGYSAGPLWARTRNDWSDDWRVTGQLHIKMYIIIIIIIISIIIIKAQLETEFGILKRFWIGWVRNAQDTRVCSYAIDGNGNFICQ